MVDKFAIFEQGYALLVGCGRVVDNRTGEMKVLGAEFAFLTPFRPRIIGSRLSSSLGFYRAFVRCLWNRCLHVELLSATLAKQVRA